MPRHLCLEALGFETFSFQVVTLEHVIVVRFYRWQSITIGLAGLIVDCFLLEVLGLENFLAEASGFEMANLVSLS